MNTGSLFANYLPSVVNTALTLFASLPQWRVPPTSAVPTAPLSWSLQWWRHSYSRP